eukprot:CAMPEP_0172587748 /NCGR_PEP_ID=MMETSP1068-20121228/6747_1 /TAXON_ID=35684 /ORGANISM="Pseudopedinella elastica, Strain CCMP716" /LENGTH=291 /DNA_ID=CAMNT_0013382865 /DNA_START=538 /DNA_END=1413 /DNA_ORIENTATION=+
MSVERDSSDTASMLRVGGRDAETGLGGHGSSSSSNQVDAEAGGEYATGPERKEAFECCRFRTRIPHYCWLNHPPCGKKCALEFTCGQKRWRTCTRLGNFTVVLEEVSPVDGSRAELYLVLGPHWPFAATFTAGIIVAFPIAAIVIFWGVLPLWSCEVLALLAGLCLVLLAWLGCGDPGIARRLAEKPPGVDNPMMGTGRGQKMGGKWMWNDQASTWRAPGDSYSQEMNVVLKDVDHICPFTGTAISRKNMMRFIFFQVSVIILGFGCVCFICWGLAESIIARERAARESGM